MAPSHDQSNTDKAISRRDLAKGLAALGIAGGVLNSAPAAAQGDGALSDDALRVLLERITNTRYTTSPTGEITYDGPVWSGEYHTAHHRNWLFNPDNGFKADPKNAMERVEEQDGVAVHAGAEVGSELASIQSVLDKTSELGVFDDDNLIYDVVRARMQFVYEHGIEHGVNDFAEWLNAQTDVDAAVKQTIADKAAAFLAIPVASASHEW